MRFLRLLRSRFVYLAAVVCAARGWKIGCTVFWKLKHEIGDCQEYFDSLSESKFQEYFPFEYLDTGINCRLVSSNHRLLNYQNFIF